ncbi:multidrug resistance protein [Gammaproteobacteria bacterium]|nr:multidrug resistance protein [Gammaproteobacteria bacterium]
MDARILLCGAIIFEVIGTTLMKLSNGFTVLVPSIFMIITYSISFASLTLCLRKMEVTIAYAIWSAVGTVLIAIVGALFFGENMSLSKIVCLLIIILGVIGLNFTDD